MCLSVCLFIFNRLYLLHLPSESLQSRHTRSLGSHIDENELGDDVARMCTRTSEVPLGYRLCRYLVPTTTKISGTSLKSAGTFIFLCYF